MPKEKFPLATAVAVVLNKTKSMKALKQDAVSLAVKVLTKASRQ